jgi:hypothetical protein
VLVGCRRLPVHFARFSNVFKRYNLLCLVFSPIPTNFGEGKRKNDMEEIENYGN